MVSHLRPDCLTIDLDLLLWRTRLSRLGTHAAGRLETEGSAGHLWRGICRMLLSHSTIIGPRIQLSRLEAEPKKPDDD
jgi:hypothetical protein